MKTIPNPRAFYSLRDQLPPLGVVVRIIWKCRGPVEAARVAHPQTRAACWLIRKRGEATFLTCNIAADQSDLWQPLKPEAWELPLPPPALTVPADFDLMPRLPATHDAAGFKTYREHGGRGIDLDGVRLWNSRQSFDAAAAAEEMEAERSLSRASDSRSGSRPDARGEKRKLWWLADAGGDLKWRPPGRITRREAEGRIMRALASEVFSRDAEGLGLHRSALIDDMDEQDVRALAEIEEGDGVPVFTASGQDNDDYALAMAWFTALGAREASADVLSASNGRRRVRPLTQRQRVLIFASRLAGLSYADIGRAMRRDNEKPLSRARVGQLLKAAFEAVWISANAFRDDGAIIQRRALDELRRSNRRAKYSKLESGTR